MHKDDAEQLFDDIERFGRYSFNKCLVPETTVVLADGVTLSIEEVKTMMDSGEPIAIKSYNTDDSTVFSDECVEVIDSGHQDTYEIELSDGSTVECTMDHKFLCSDNKKHELREIIEKDLEILAI